MVDIILDCLFQLLHATKDSVANTVAGDVTEPAFDHIQPRTAGRDKMNVETLVAFQPTQNLRMLVRRIVIDDQMQIEFRRRLCLNLFQEFDLFMMTMPGHAVRNDFSFSQFNGCEQCCGSIAFVVVCLCLQSSGEKWKAFWCPVECLNLALLVTGKDQRMFRWIEVETDHIHKLLSKSWIVRNFERLDAMRLQPIIRPDSLHRVFADADRTGHAADRPLHCVGGVS